VNHAVFLLGRRDCCVAIMTLVAAGMVTIFANGTPWVGSWKMALDWGTGSVVLVGPVAAGWAAFTYASLGQRGWPEFAAGFGRLRRAWLDPVVAIWMTASAAVLITTSTTLVSASMAGSRAATSSLWIIGEAFLVLAAQVGIGAVLGHLMRGLWAAPLAALVVFALAPMSVLGYLPGVFDTGSVSSSLVGQTWSIPVLGWSSALTAGLAALCMCALMVRVSPAQRWTIWVTAVVALATLLTGWSVLEYGGHERYRFDRSTPEWVCRGVRPLVCMDADTTRPLDFIASEMERQARVFAELGAPVPVPGRFDQQVPGRVPAVDHGVLFLLADDETGSSVDPRAVSLSLAMPRPCEDFVGSSVPLKAVRAQAVIAAWIADRADVPHADAVLGRGEQLWLHLDIANQADWMVTTYTQLAACDLGSIRLPF
jgi:hypothetical protein